MKLASPLVSNTGTPVGYNFRTIGANQSTSTPSSLSSPLPALTQLETDIKKLQIDLAGLTADKDATTTRFGSTGFRNQDDAVAWIMKTPGAESFDLITDVNLFTTLMFKEINRDYPISEISGNSKKIRI
mmetsp:Transcript_30744/g.46615  ORF Transcript_30744/g.46615 Transcript_30744/m.46615 type:complete len:129 (+) Transcript_30744:438-824(+)